MDNDSEKTNNGAFVAFMIALLIIIIVYMLILVYDQKHLVGPMGPPGPVSVVPTIVLPYPTDSNTKALFGYKSAVTIIIPTSTYPVISDDLPNPDPCIINIEVYKYRFEGTSDYITYVYTLHYTTTAEGSYLRVRTVNEADDTVVVDSDWILTTFTQ